MALLLSGWFDFGLNKERLNFGLSGVLESTAVLSVDRDFVRWERKGKKEMFEGIPSLW